MRAVADYGTAREAAGAIKLKLVENGFELVKHGTWDLRLRIPKPPISHGVGHPVDGQNHATRYPQAKESDHHTVESMRSSKMAIRTPLEAQIGLKRPRRPLIPRKFREKSRGCMILAAYCVTRLAMVTTI